MKATFSDVAVTFDAQRGRKGLLFHVQKSTASKVYYGLIENVSFISV